MQQRTSKVGYDEYSRRDKTKNYGKLFIARVGVIYPCLPRVFWKRAHIFRWYKTHFASACQMLHYKGTTPYNPNALSANYPSAKYIKTITLEEVYRLPRGVRCKVCFPDENWKPHDPMSDDIPF